MRIATDLVFALMLATVSVTDLRSRRIPNPALATTVAVGLPLLGVDDAGAVPGRLLVAFLAGGAFLVISLWRPDGFGMGDVKLIATMGLFLGGAVLAAITIALGSASLLGLGLLLRDGRGAARATIPFGPFLALGGMLTMLGWVPSLQ